MKYLKRIGAVTMSGILVAGLMVSGSYIQSQAKINHVQTALQKEKADQKTNNEDVKKEETVYVNTNEAGEVSGITVSDWLKNSAGKSSVTDTSDLTDISNVKGEETFAQDGDKLTWNTKDADIYYQGTSTQELPVSVTITYQLDGKEISAEDLAGKSGVVTMKITYVNNKKYKDVVKNNQEDLVVPFAMVSGVILPVDQFTDVSVEGGKMISEGNNQICIGMGFPGLKDSLSLDKDMADKFNQLGDTVTITANVREFSMDPVYTVATNDLFEDVDTKDLDSLDELDDAIDKLVSSTQQLLDGSKDLSDGLKTLKESFATYAQGVTTLNNGTKQLKKGAKTLKAGVNDYTKGTDSLTTNTKKYIAGVDTLTTGMNSYITGASQITTGISTLNNSVKELPGKYTAFSAGLQKYIAGVNQIADPQNLAKLQVGSKSVASGIDTLNAVASQVSGGLDTINTNLGQLEDSYQNNESCIQGLKSIMSSLPDGAAKTQLGGIITSLENVTSVQKNTVTQLKAATAKSSQLGKGVSGMEAGTASTSALRVGAGSIADAMDAIGAGTPELSTGSSQLLTADAEFSKGMTSISTAVSQLNTGAASLSANNKTLTDGIATLTTSGKALSAGATTLSKSSKKLNTGSKNLAAAINKLATGTSKLNTSTSEVKKGIGDLYDGSTKLYDGLDTFNKEGIQKIQTEYQDNVVAVLQRVKSMVNNAKDYKSFSGISDKMDGSVKFVFQSSEIKSK